ncbi:MAG: dTDP-glucose 4,6-dehydratase [Candidatus Latescibacteria bacterium]|nr:dTDP-glucose 4,6-dehydratase [Candidatus Latescibacterota bacterium]NIM22317.1 dTDP-glucose 4,6-dehydratase [Candidatus Latescibacterota bacterium]NIM66146.1 dTDP-glucose 4,6-dehydratase [Candidatus Latescibacterota bacterium]NIO02554.1 dTDP-glucose 4,6-dehydratase [Candidatus Latescibacterota bacterium]NIO29468.1 dTDP-glucose 4,6-dehydratase [Candidatus Latescibacterota bacterium]
MKFFRSVLITGGAGFIGSNFVHYLLKNYPECKITVLDALTYAGNLENLSSVLDDSRVTFIKGSICDPPLVSKAIKGSEAVFNFAAETHVDRSIEEAGSFIQTDVFGTYTLLRQALESGVERFIQISTDEVYGSASDRAFREDSPLKPGNPYSASKCGGDLMSLAFRNTYQAPVVITRSSNNFGPYQHVEKFIPLFITNTIEGKDLPLYGDGMHQRDWIYVDDNCSAIAMVALKGELGAVYNIGAGESRPNLLVAERILDLLGAPKTRIVFIEDRKGHDRVYAMDAKRIRKLGWKPEWDFDRALEQTVKWYCNNREWWESVKSGAFREYYEKHYSKKLKEGKSRGA